MSLNYINTYGNRVDATDPNYVYGKIKNKQGDTAGTGTPVDSQWLNDWVGLQQKLLVEAGITPSGVPDNIAASDVYDALLALFGNSGNSVNTIQGLLALDTTNFTETTQASVASYHNIFNGGGGKFIWIPDKPKADHNGGTVIDPDAPYPTDWNDVAQQSSWFSSSNPDNGVWVRLFDKTVDVKWFGAWGDYTDGSLRDDYIPLTTCFQNSYSEIEFPRGHYRVSQPITALVAGRDLIGQTKHNETIISGDFAGGVIENTTGQWWKNTFKNISFDNRFNDPNAAGLKGTMYQCTVINCGFTAIEGKGLHLLGNAYCVETEIRQNYFNGCKYGIYAESGSNANTDAYVVDNYFWKGSFSRETTIENSIYWETPSGSTFRGNHPYGGANDAMFRFEGGVNVSLIDNYFEESNNPRVKISSGNPGSYTLVGNKFWRGDGTTTQTNGDKAAIISLGFNLYNRGVITLTGNVFEGGVNDVPIFSFRNGALGISDVKISFDKSNIIAGSYNLADLATSGSADINVFGRIDTDHNDFIFENTTQNKSVASEACSEFHQYDTGNATTFMTLPNHTNWVAWKPKILRNFSGTTEISLSSGATINNNRAIKPNEVVMIRAVNSNTYYIEFLKEEFTGLQVTTYPTVAMDFGTTTVPANGYVESNIDTEGYAMTNPNTVMTCVMKGLSAGLIATFYYDGTTFNTWKMRITNPTASAISLNSTTAIVNIFS